MPFYTNINYRNLGYTEGYVIAANKISKNVKLVAKTFNSWNSTRGASITVPAGHYFIVNTSSCIASSGEVDNTYSHTNGVIYQATNSTTVSWTQTTDSANYYNCLQVVYWPMN